MTKKERETIEKTFRQVFRGNLSATDLRRNLAQELGAKLAQDDPAFNLNRFLSGCGALPSEVHSRPTLAGDSIEAAARARRAYLRDGREQRRRETFA